MYKEEKVYTRRVINLCGKECYFVAFEGQSGDKVDIEVEAHVYDAIREFELIEARIARSDRRHFEHFALSDSETESRALRKLETTEMAAISKICAERLAAVIAELPPLQRKRYLLFYNGGMRLKDIADREGCSIPSVSRSIRRADKKVREAYKNFFTEG